MSAPVPTPRSRPRRVTLRDGRSVTLRAIVAADAPEIIQAFERLTSDSRYARFMHHKRQLNPEALQRAVHPVAGRDFVYVATVPADDGIDIVGAAQYLPVREGDSAHCEFAITVVEDWHGSGLAKQLMASLIRRARHDGYATMEGLVLAANSPMLGLAKRLGFKLVPCAEDPTVVTVRRTLVPASRLQP
jgi:RimJ/RimL family protein N-acetyltransferase